MKKKVSVVLSAAILIAASSVFARTIDPIVSTDELEDMLDVEDLVIVDIRSANDYSAGHIPGAINEPWIVPFSAWITMTDGLLLEMPADVDLEGAIGNLGIDAASKVVVVGAPNPPPEPAYYGAAGAVRVALTLIYAGVPNVAVLDGGQPKWELEGKATTTDVPAVTPVTFEGCFDYDLIATIDEVDALNYSATLIDARDADVYFGATTEDMFAPEPGHIPGATSLPGPFAFDAVDDVVTFEDLETLEDMAKGVVQTNWPFWVPVERKDVIVYCGVGGYGAIWTYVLQEVLGYRSVKLYDGSAQEWIMAGYDLNTYIWEW